MPPPPDAAHDYLEYFRRNMAQRQSEGEELRRLKREIEKKKLEAELAGLSVPTKPPQPKRQSLDYYADQIAAWFNRLPPEARKAPRTMEEFVNLLVGRTPGMRAHGGDVSRVLRQMGWLRRRSWEADGQGTRLWWPPVW
jgi:hypothetical protein